MRRAGRANLTVGLALLLLAVILFLSSGLGPKTLDSEKVFIFRVYNSLHWMDRAKQQWAEEKNKSEVDTPTLQDLMPYLRDGKDATQKLIALGINYRITSTEKPQSDVATLTRDLHFRSGICHFYPAGTSYCLQTGKAFPEPGATSSSRAHHINNQHLVAVALCALAVGNFVAFAIKRHRENSHSPPER